MDFSTVIEFIKLLTSLVKLYVYVKKLIKALKKRKKKPP